MAALSPFLALRVTDSRNRFLQRKREGKLKFSDTEFSKIPFPSMETWSRLRTLGPTKEKPRGPHALAARFLFAASFCPSGGDHAFAWGHIADRGFRAL
ncbi:hypothetical protein AAFO92_03870 [Roseovarius sp. CAU 1744]|uniref:hypothetical protein n=1 Tax=Roseovarius sp. CAU 1744 TaxID=3140368 RepID=UPI00325C0C4F